MHRIAIAIFAAMVVGACGAGTVPTPAPGGITTPTQRATTAQPPGSRAAATIAPAETDAPQPTTGGPAPAPGGATVSVTLTGGGDAGTYTGTADPGCSQGFVGTGMWGVQYSIFEGSAVGQLSNVSVIYQPEDAGTPATEGYAYLDLKADIGIGPLFDPAAYHVYSIEVHRDGSGSKGTGTMQVNDAGSTAVLHMTGTTEDGMAIDLTVNCPSVTRG